MKRALAEVWVTDELAAEAGDHITEAKLKEAFDEEAVEHGVLGIRLTLPDGTVLRAGQTFG